MELLSPRSWNQDLLILNQALYPWSYPSIPTKATIVCLIQSPKLDTLHFQPQRDGQALISPGTNLVKLGTGIQP